MYEIKLLPPAEQGARALKKSAPASYRKLLQLLTELREHPYTGTGRPERLRHNGGTVWSRRIDLKNRLIYTVCEEQILVLVLSVTGHYDDK